MPLKSSNSPNMQDDPVSGSQFFFMSQTRAYYSPVVVLQGVGLGCFSHPSLLFSSVLLAVYG